MDLVTPLEAELGQWETPELLSASQPFIGKWNRLVSTTNWEKGKIIHQWRESLVATGVDIREYSDEAWSRMVGGISSQHVGRLRRVFARFGEMQNRFKGLFWSHFQASLDWADAEMWLEGAVQSGWSVANMREQRWETLGRLESERPQESDIIATEVEEDFVSPASAESSGKNATTTEFDGPTGPRFDGPDFGDEGSGASRSFEDDNLAAPGTEMFVQAPLVSPFADLPQMPDDMADAYEQLKLVLVRQKASGFADISRDDCLRAVEALRVLLLAPSSESAPF